MITPFGKVDTDRPNIGFHKIVFDDADIRITWTEDGEKANIRFPHASTEGGGAAVLHIVEDHEHGPMSWRDVTSVRVLLEVTLTRTEHGDGYQVWMGDEDPEVLFDPERRREETH